MSMKPHKDGNLRHGHQVETKHHNKPHPHLDPAHKSGKESGHDPAPTKHHKPDNKEYPQR